MLAADRKVTSTEECWPVEREALVLDALITDKVEVLERLAERKLFDPQRPVEIKRRCAPQEFCAHRPVVLAAWRSSRACLDFLVQGWTVVEIRDLLDECYHVFACSWCSRAPTYASLANVYSAFRRIQKQADLEQELTQLNQRVQRLALAKGCADLFRSTLDGKESNGLEAVMVDCLRRFRSSSSYSPDRPPALDLLALALRDQRDAGAQSGLPSDRWRYVVLTYLTGALDVVAQQELLRNLVEIRRVWSKQQHLDLVLVRWNNSAVAALPWLFDSPAPAAVKALHVGALLEGADNAAATSLETVLRHLPLPEVPATRDAIHEWFVLKNPAHVPSILQVLREAKLFPAETRRLVVRRLQGIGVRSSECASEWKLWQQWDDVQELLAQDPAVDLGSLPEAARRVVWDQFLLRWGWSVEARETKRISSSWSIPLFEARARFLVDRGFCWQSPTNVIEHLKLKLWRTKSRREQRDLKRTSGCPCRVSFDDPVSMACGLWPGNSAFTTWLIGAVVALSPCGRVPVPPHMASRKARRTLENLYHRPVRRAVSGCLKHVADLVDLVVHYLDGERQVFTQ